MRNLETLAEKAKFTRRGPVPPTFDVNRVYSDAVLQGWRFWTRGWSLLRALVLGIAWWFCLRLLGFPMRAKLVYARWARQEMVRQGAVFIKLGQMLSTRVDAFSPEVVDELSRLQDQVPGFDFRVVQAVIEADFAVFDRERLERVRHRNEAARVDLLGGNELSELRVGHGNLAGNGPKRNKLSSRIAKGSPRG